MAYAQCLTALADPTRRKLYEKLRRNDHSVGDLAKFAKISQPAASQHLRVLKAARLVASRRDGTHRFYRASPEGLADLRRYVEGLWDDVLEAFAADDPHASKARRAR